MKDIIEVAYMNIVVAIHSHSQLDPLISVIPSGHPHRYLAAVVELNKQK